MSERAPLQPVRRTHLVALSAGGPVAQHARGTVPDPVHGSCTDDVARALQVDLLHAAALGWPAVAASAGASLRYLEDAFVAETGRFRNFRNAEGRWLEAVGSEDAHGRAVLALGEAVATARDVGFRERAGVLLQRSLPGTLALGALRARSSALIGLDRAGRAGLAGLGPARRYLGEALAERFEAVAWSLDWPWPEPVLTYETALPPRALILAGPALGDLRVTEIGLAVLHHLARSAVAPGGHLSPIGNDGWWPRDGARARFDQQPIEATALLLAAETAYDATGDPRQLDDMERAYAWFLGANDLGIPIADTARGGCHDGLRADGFNGNQGAESTLAWLTALERIRAVRSRRPAAVGA